VLREQPSKLVVSYLAPNQSTKSQVASLWTSEKNPDLAARVWWFGKKTDLGNRPDAGAHQADTVEIGLLAGALLCAFARLIALV
jgi:hypothetical protein